MADSHDPFPNVKEKLTARTKKSAFEKSRLEAEAKRLREEAETAAVYKDFVASFDQEPSSSTSGASDFAGARGSHGGARGSAGDSRGGLRGGPPSGPGRRHFTSAPPRAAQAPILSNRKRNIESIFEREDEVSVFGSAGLSDRDKRRLRESNTGLLAFENSAPPNRSQDQYSPDDGSGTPGLCVRIGNLGVLFSNGVFCFSRFRHSFQPTSKTYSSYDVSSTFIHKIHIDGTAFCYGVKSRLDSYYSSPTTPRSISAIPIGAKGGVSDRDVVPGDTFLRYRCCGINA